MLDSFLLERPSMKKRLLVAYVTAQVTFLGFAAVTGHVPGLRPLAQWEVSQFQSAGVTAPQVIVDIAGGK